MANGFSNQMDKFVVKMEKNEIPNQDVQWFFGQIGHFIVPFWLRYYFGYPNIYIRLSYYRSRLNL
jgi:hypothetical protein